MKNSIKVAVRVFAILSMVTVVGVAQSGVHISTSGMYLMPIMDSAGKVVVGPRHIDGAHATLYTNDEGAMAWITTSRIEVGHAVSLWWVVFNYPEYCIDSCNDDDFYGNAGITGASMIGAMGTVVTNPDEIKLFSHIDAGDESIADIGPGLLNPRTAEIHLVLRDHGPANPEILMEQLSTYLGGCDPKPPHDPCEDIQFAIFMQ